MIHFDPYAVGERDSLVLFRNVLSEGALSASSETPDGFAANALGPQTYDFWTPASLPASLGVALGAPAACDACAIIAHTLGSAGATVAVQHHDGTDWVTSQTVTPKNDSDLLLVFAEAAASQWRILVSGPVVPHLGVVMIGPRLLIPLGVQPDYVPLNLALDVQLSGNVTRGGQFRGSRIEKRGAATSIQLAPQERWWIETEAAGFIAHYNAGKPFIWAGCPEILPDDMGYCWRSGGTLQVGYGAEAIYGSISLEVEAYVGG